MAYQKALEQGAPLRTPPTGRIGGAALFFLAVRYNGINEGFRGTRLEPDFSNIRR